MFSTLKHTDTIWKVRKFQGKKKKSVAKNTLTPRAKVFKRESREVLWHDAVNEYRQHPLPL